MRLGLKSAFGVVASFVLVLAITAIPAQGCQICRCGDPTFNALGTDVYVAGAFRVALDWERIEKREGICSRGG